MHMLTRQGQFPEDNGPMAHPIRPDSYVAMDNFYTDTVYNKGAEVIRIRLSTACGCPHPHMHRMRMTSSALYVCVLILL